MTLTRLAPLIDVALGTEDEVKAGAGFAKYTVTHGQETHAEVEGDLDEAISARAGDGHPGAGGQARRARGDGPPG